jgi:hypothetical protein
MEISVYKGVITDRIHIHLSQKKEDLGTSLISVDITVSQEEAERLIDKLSHFVRECIEEKKHE